MTENEKRPGVALALLVLFFVSGVSALLYQVVWLKYLGFVFGNTVYAAATLIAVFLAGLGIGGYLFSRFAVKRDALILYAVVEASIGILGSLSPKAFQLLDQAYIASYQSFSDSPFLLALFRALLASLFLLPPTILMGGTLPLLVRWRIGSSRAAGNAVSTLYAANTFGATAGVALSGFFTIPTIGLTATIALAVALNFLLAIASVVLAIARRRHDGEAAGPDAGEVQQASSPLPISPRWILFASFLMGFTSIADEVFWSRILVLHLGSSVYAYALMLFCFLVGLASGSAVISRVIDRIDPIRTLALLEIGLAVALALQVHYFAQFADVLETMARGFGVGSDGQALATFLSSTLSALLIPTAIMGATFPIVVKLYGRARAQSESRSVGVVYLANTIGSILGSFLAGFALIRLVGSQNGLFLMAVLNFVVGATFWFVSAQRKKDAALLAAAAAAVVIAFVTARPDQVILAAGLFADRKAPILLFREDVTATVTLRKLGPDYLSLELNGVNVAGTAGDLIGTQKLQGHLPLLMHPNPKKVLHIGFGSGGTAFAVAQHPVDQIRIAEISPEVLEVSNSTLRAVNHGVLGDPRVKAEINDGRNFVLATPEKFDVILSDSIHPRYAGNGSLYTKDYFELCRAKLAPGGIVSMWLPTYSLTTHNYLQIVRAFYEVFPNTTLWYVPNAPNAFTIVIGRMEQGPLPADRLVRNWNPKVAKELADIGIRNVYELSTALMLDGPGIGQLTRGVAPHVDDLPSVEYESGRLVNRDYWWLRNFDVLVRAMSPIGRAFTGLEDAAAVRRAEEIRLRRAVDHLQFIVKTM